MRGPVYICRSCGEDHADPNQGWACPTCYKEVCESCFDRIMHCKTCSKNKTDDQLREAANKEGWDV